MEKFQQLLLDSGLANLTLGQLVMMIGGVVLIYLAIAKRLEPLLLLPIGFGTLLVNIPGAE
ncbi:sodium ion-translocating decarboxylase subunit beta, partial [Reinekea sp.]|uniref:sodium ion-translocating decarboxylase subunit beta n=1 Tax=Reinekea sp. TaxID=1970455 RepID=UPI002A8405DC